MQQNIYANENKIVSTFVLTESKFVGVSFVYLFFSNSAKSIPDGADHYREEIFSD